MVMVASPGATAERPRRATSGWRVGRTLAVSLVGSLVAFGLAGGITAAGSWTGRARLLAICLIYGNCIGLAARFAIPAWLRRFTRRNRLSWWLGRVMALPLLILLGGGLGAGILILIGLIPPSSYVTYVFPYVRGGRTLAAVVSIFMAVTAYEYMRDRLDITSLALRTKERDEAEARRLAAEAQLASLESRVHPHFLFNTLNSIASLIPRDPAGAERMTGQLASLLRSSLDTASNAVVPLEQEIKIVRDYLDIERVRFGERLRYEIQVPPELWNAPVPRLSVQTLVENSVKYAVTPRREGGSIQVVASAIGKNLRLEVADDGPGFDPRSMPLGHGLALLRDRLAITFGEKAHVSVDCRPGRTAVTIDIADCPFLIAE